MLLPTFPVYIPSKGRADLAGTARVLTREAVPFFLVVEPQEVATYRSAFPAAQLLVLPENEQGLVYARNWIKQHSIAAGFSWHWQLDDNIRRFHRRFQGYRLPCHSGYALHVTERFVERYENIAIAGLNYRTFIQEGTICPPFHLNARVYSCCLIRNDLPYGWRGQYNDDADLCLRVLADGYCTVGMNAFLADKLPTMHAKGGNTDALYQGDGRLKMARSLERLWPGVVSTQRRFNRPQHVVRDQWTSFTTELRLKPGIDLAALPPVDEFGAQLQQVSPAIKSATLRKLIADSGWDVVRVESDSQEEEA